MSGRHGPESQPAERPLRVYVNDNELVTLMATPERLKELAFGWLWANGLIARASDVTQILIDAERSIIWARIKGEAPTVLKSTIGSGCGGGQMIADLTGRLPKVNADLKIPLAALSKLQADFMKQAVLYRQTGGVHGAALADPGGVLFVAEDIGRHNAVDKVIGWLLMNELPASDKIILTTGRISSEMLAKAATAGVPVVGSRTAATDLAVAMARQAGLALVGYIRGRDGVVYAGRKRLI